MNDDTALSVFVMILAAIGVALLILLIPAPAGASAICLTKKEARHLWPKQHIYWYSKDHCWSDRRGPPRNLKIDPVLDTKAQAEKDEAAPAAKTKPPSKLAKIPAVRVEAPLRTDQQVKITQDGCCWPQLTEFELMWDKIIQALKGK